MTDQPWTTKRFLLDHLRRIITHVSEAGGEWTFGVGKDTLVSWKPWRSSEEEDKWAENEANWAAIRLFISALGLKTRDRIGGREEVEEYLDHLFNPLYAAAGGPKLTPEQFLDQELPADASSEALQQAFIFEMLQKLDDMVERSRQSVQKRSLLGGVSKHIDEYMAEAATAFRYGLDRASISMCRASLEIALKERIKRLYSESLLVVSDRSGPKSEIDLKGLIRVAFDKKKFIAHSYRNFAEQIRRAGNDAVHGRIAKQDLRTVAQETLLNTRIILVNMYRQTTP